MPEPRIIGAKPAPAAPEQPSFPLTNFQVMREGVLMSVQLSPTIAINAVIPEQTMNQIVVTWLETRKKIKEELALVAEVQRTKQRN